MQLRAGGVGVGVGGDWVGKNKQRGPEEEVNEGKEGRDGGGKESGAARIR